MLRLAKFPRNTANGVWLRSHTAVKLERCARWMPAMDPDHKEAYPSASCFCAQEIQTNIQIELYALGSAEGEYIEVSHRVA